MNAINDFYIKSSVEKRKQMFSIIHWFLMGQSYDHEWEQFDNQYKVLDGLFNLNSGTGAHSARPRFLAEKYGVMLPESPGVRIVVASTER
jgi:hypothetical protein